MEATKREEYWIRRLDELRTELDNMQLRGADKKELWLVNSYMKYLESLLMFSNLQRPSSDNATELAPGVFKGKRCVQICSRIPSWELDKNYINWFIFNGLYVEAEVMFLDETIYHKIYNKRRQINIPEELAGIINPSTVLLNSVHEIAFEDNGTVNRFYAFLCTRELFKGYCQYNSNWQYPYIIEDK